MRQDVSRPAIDEQNPLRHEVIFPADQVAEAIERVAGEIARDHLSHDLLLIAVLEGGAWFHSRLTESLAKRGVKTASTVVRVHRSSGARLNGSTEIEPRFETDVTPALPGRHVIYVDDICDEGEALRSLMKRTPDTTASVEAAVLVERVARPRPSGFVPDYVGLKADTEAWLLGCGMDLDGRYRDLPYVAGVAPKGDADDQTRPPS